MNEDDARFLKRAIELSRESFEKGGFPAGAVIVKNGTIIGEGISVGNVLNDPTSHGEIAAIRDACKNIKSANLSESALYTSMQPCLMCFMAATWGNVSKIIYACAKENVSLDYYAGNGGDENINACLAKPIPMAQISELEAESLAVVRVWEQTLIIPYTVCSSA